MPVKSSLARARQRCLFKKSKRTMAAQRGATATAGSRADTPGVEEEVVSHMAELSTRRRPFAIDPLYTAEPPIADALVSVTSEAQDKTVEMCLPLLAAEDSSVEYNAHGVPHLHRQRHIAYLESTLGNLPAPFVAADASRPWCMYWALNGLSMLGADVSKFSEGLIATARHMQNEAGGFGGGFGQRSHLATTYAMVLSLAIVGGEPAYDIIDRRAMWKWLSALKQPDGGFQMSLGGEVDVR